MNRTSKIPSPQGLKPNLYAGLDGAAESRAPFKTDL